MVASVGRITAGTGYRYLADEVATSRHDYYAGRGEAPGIWAGSGRHELDLRGTVRTADMDALFGRLVDPRTTGRDAAEVPLGRRVTARTMHAGTPREHVAQPIAALDATFSPSKSVSALWAAHPSAVVRETVAAAHDAAVTAGLDYLEASASHTRTGAGGLERAGSTGFIVAKFRHRTARSTAPDERIGDPQLHTHCAILNRVKGHDGVWRTLDSKAIYRHAHAAGALYGATLERELTNRLGVEWKTPNIEERVPMREIIGVPDSVISRWSSRRRQVMSTYEQLTDDFRSSHGRTPTRDEQAQLKDRATIQSRERKSGGISDLHTEWRSQLASEELASIEHAPERVAHDAVTGGRFAPDSNALRARIVATLESQRSWWTPVHVYAEAAKWISDPTHENIEQVVDLTLDDCVCLQPGDDTAFDATKYSSQKILDAEAEVLTAASEPSWTIAPHPAEHLGDDQVRAVEALTSKPHRVATNIGPAGAGKTTMLKSVAESYQRAKRPVCVLALAANAARVVTDETGLPADTIASWSKGNLQLPKNGLVLVDEASLVPTLTLRQLVRAAHTNGSRLGLVGDYAQMGSPEAGGLLRDLAALPSATTLTSVRRFRAEWERSASIQLHEREPDAALHYFEHDRVIETTSERGNDSVAAAWFGDRAKGLESIIVVDTNHEAADISATCQGLLDQAGALGNAVGIGADRNELRIGDQIQTRDNNSQLRTSDGRRVLNRDVWTVTGGTDDGTVMAKHIRHCRTVEITPEYVQRHTVLAYGATVAGAQGRTTDTGHVLVSPRTNAASLYVGMTRGRQTNHAHVITDGHDHDELGTGHKTGFHGFADALARNPDGDTSATTVKKQYATTEAKRQADKQIEEAAHQWTRARASLTLKMRSLLKGHDVAIVQALVGSDAPINLNVSAAAREMDWNQPAVAANFIAALNEHEPTGAGQAYRPSLHQFSPTPRPDGVSR